MTDVAPSVAPTEAEREAALRALAHPDRLREVFGSVLYRSGDARQKAHECCTLVATLLRCRHAAVNLVAGDSQVHIAVEDGRSVPTEDVPIARSVCQYVAATAKPFVVVDAYENRELHPLEVLAAGGMRCYLGVPLMHAGQVIGSLCVYDPGVRQWTLNEIALLTAWAEVLMGLEGAELAEEQDDDGR